MLPLGGPEGHGRHCVTVSTQLSGPFVTVASPWDAPTTYMYMSQSTSYSQFLLGVLGTNRDRVYVDHGIKKEIDKRSGSYRVV